MTPVTPIELPAANEVAPLPALDLDAGEVTGLPVATTRWGATTLADVLRRHDARGLVVVHRGRLVLDWTSVGGDPGRRHLCYSVTKSFTGTLAAVAVHDGTLDRSALVGDVVPELASSGFGGATVGQIADMTASIGYDEDYDDVDAGPSADGVLGFGDYMAAAVGADRPAGESAPGPGTLRELLASVGPGSGAHGEVFEYGTPVTDVLAWLLERSTGVTYGDLLRDSLWSHLGAETGATLLVDAAGTPLAGGGLLVTTRDLARFGDLLLGRGGGRAVPAEVLEAIRGGGDPSAFERGHYAHLTGYTYRDQWWMPSGPSRPLSAWGIHGQLLWVDPEAELVVACHCVGPAASDERRDAEQDAMCRALTEAAAAWSGA